MTTYADELRAKTAKNILAAGRAERLNACGASVRPPLTVAAGDEAGTQQERSLTGCTDRNPHRSRRGGRQEIIQRGGGVDLGALGAYCALTLVLGMILTLIVINVVRWFS